MIKGIQMRKKYIYKVHLSIDQELISSEKRFLCISSHLRLSCIRRTYRSIGACIACLGYRLVLPTTLFDLSPTTARTRLTSVLAGLHALCSLLRLIRPYIVGRTSLSSTEPGSALKTTRKVNFEVWPTRSCYL